MGLRQRNGRWLIDYYDKNGQRHYETIGPSKKLAQQVLARRQTEIIQDKYQDPQLAKILYEEAEELYLEWSEEHKKASKEDKRMLQYFRQDFAGMPVTKITSWHIEQAKHRILKGGATGPTVNRYLACLSGMYHRLKDWGLFVGENPVKAVKKFRENPGRIRYLTVEEIERLLGYCNEDLKAAVTIAINTGVRAGELFALRWSDIDLANRIIRIADSKNNTRRDIPMNDGVHIVLDARSKKKSGEYVFIQTEDKPHTTRMRTAWKLATKKAGLADVRWHDLRHTFASHLVMQGANLFAVQQLMGHKSLEMTRRYSHLAPGVLRTAVEAMDKIMNHGTQQEEGAEKLVATEDVAS